MKSRLIVATAIAIALLVAGCGLTKPGARAGPVVRHGPPASRAGSLRKVISAPIVGERLTSTRGSWSNAPTAYAYAWQRCTGTGTGCVAISGAAAATYIVITADVGHELASQVKACNTSGCASQQSNLSGVAVASSGGPITGASLASCTGGTCGVGTLPDTGVNMVTGISVSPGAGIAAENREYGYYIPSNLKHDGSSDGQPAAVFDLARQGCSEHSLGIELADSNLVNVADAGHFIVILMPCNPAVNGGNWRHGEIDCGPLPGCNQGISPPVGGGSSGPGNDVPYIKAVVNDATTRFNLDPVRRYLVGGSSAANMTRDTICSQAVTPHAALLFRGAMTMGGGIATTLGGHTGVCPGGDKQTFYLEIVGKNSSADPYTDISTSNHTVMGIDNSRAWWSGRTTAGAVQAGGYLNCAAAVHTNTGSGVLSDVYSYHCANGNSTSPFYEAVAVTNGGHMWCYLDSTNGADSSNPDHSLANCISAFPTHVPPFTTHGNTGGFQTAQFMWNYFAGTTTS